jgi:hypothetical protein
MGDGTPREIAERPVALPRSNEDSCALLSEEMEERVVGRGNGAPETGLKRTLGLLARKQFGLSQEIGGETHEDSARRTITESTDRSKFVFSCTNRRIFWIRGLIWFHEGDLPGVIGHSRESWAADPGERAQPGGRMIVHSLRKAVRATPFDYERLLEAIDVLRETSVPGISACASLPALGACPLPCADAHDSGSRIFRSGPIVRRSSTAG